MNAKQICMDEETRQNITQSVRDEMKERLGSIVDDMIINKIERDGCNGSDMFGIGITFRRNFAVADYPDEDFYRSMYIYSMKYSILEIYYKIQELAINHANIVAATLPPTKINMKVVICPNLDDDVILVSGATYLEILPIFQGKHNDVDI